MSQLIRGLIAPNLTPFNNDWSVADDLYVAHGLRLLANGCAGLAPFGTTGEALSVGIDERMGLLEKLVEAGADATRLIPGTGLTNLPDTVRLIKHAAALGCAGAMVLPPFYYKNLADDGVYNYFARLIELTSANPVAIYLYHIPQVAGVGLPVKLVRRLRADFPERIVGIKDSSGVWENTAALLEIDGLTVYPGSELPLAEAMARGAPGCISATANLNAPAIARRIADLANDNPEPDDHSSAAIRALRLAVQDFGPIPAQKRLLAMASGDPRWANVRPPLLPLSKSDGAKLAQRLAEETGFNLETIAGRTGPLDKAAAICLPPATRRN